MPKRKTQAAKGIPGKAANPNRKIRYAEYRKRSTCWCGSAFRSPKKKRVHELEKHPQLN